ncbi:multidrug transporter [Yeosuana marina]|uniref:multidrug transporter n=1 Tax=Yeosuana marina TaxID=1565536 RepID=UPI00141EE74C|nr:multidrug transporter [Yeosuana marina]
MKNNLILGLAIITLLFSCTTDDTADIVINDNSVTNNTGGGGETTKPLVYISGTMSTNLTLSSDNQYILNGPLIMEAGTTLTIPAGMTIKAEATGASVYIAISQGAKIIAEGTADKPIVLTSNASNPVAGNWGGLILLGKAPVNSVTGTQTSTSEIGSLPYGGTDPTDNSGSLKYVRLEYSGGAASGSSENNGFSFYGVGSGTVVDYIESYEGKDDGAEFFGGTVNVSHYVAVNNHDDSIDWTEGFSGSITDAYVVHGPDHDNGIEADGYNTDYSHAAAFWSNPTLTNITIIGNGSADGRATHFRVGTKASLNNLYIQGFSLAFQIDGDAADNPTGAWIADGSLHVTDITFNDVTTVLKDVSTGEAFTESQFIEGVGNGTATDFATWGAGWSRE